MKNSISERRLREYFKSEALPVQRHFICSETDCLHRRISEVLSDILFANLVH